MAAKFRVDLRGGVSIRVDDRDVAQTELKNFRLDLTTVPHHNPSDAVGVEREVCRVGDVLVGQVSDRARIPTPIVVVKAVAHDVLDRRGDRVGGFPFAR
jgi:hypothetical protein